jgi:hypothetical protein
MPKPGSTRSSLGDDQPGQALRIPTDPSQARAHRKGLAVQAVEHDLEAPRALALGLQPLADQVEGVAGHAGQILQGADRLEEGQAVEPGRGRTTEDQGLGGLPQGLVEAQGQAHAEPLGQLGARQAVELADAEQAQARQLRHRRLVQPQGRHRQVGQERALAAGRGDGQVLPEPRQRPGRAGGVGDRRPGRHAPAGQARDQVDQHGRLPAPQVVGPCDVEEEAVVAVDRHGRREPHAPVAQGLQCGAVGGRVVVGGVEVGRQRQGVGGLLAGGEAQGLGALVDGGEAAGSAFGDEESEGLGFWLG